MKQSNFLSLGWRDLLRGFLIGLIAFALTWLQEAFIPALNLPMEVKTMLIAFAAYLGKNLFTKPYAKSEIVGDRPPTSGGR